MGCKGSPSVCNGMSLGTYEYNDRMSYGHEDNVGVGLRGRKKEGSMYLSFEVK